MGIDAKTKSLIAIGASITANCQPCLKHLEAKARENGASDEEISEAIEVGISVRSGAASQMDKFAFSFCKKRPSMCGSPASGKCSC